MFLKERGMLPTWFLSADFENSADLNIKQIAPYTSLIYKETVY